MPRQATSSPSPSPLPAAQGSSLSFTQGFLLGQLSIALLIFFFIKFFIFGEPPSADDRALHLSSLRRARTLAHQQSFHQRPRSNSTTNPLHHKHSRSIIRREQNTGGPSIATILAKTYYNVKGHQPESLDWFNVLIAQTIAQLRADARRDGAVLTSLTELLNSGTKPDWIGEIKITEIALGDEFPIFSNCRVMPAEDGFGSKGGSGGVAGHEEGRLQARMDVDLSDVITLGIETTLVLNYPKPLVAVLPVALAVTVVRFSGTLALSFIPSSPPPAAPAASSPTSSTNPRHLREPSPEPPRPSSSSGNSQHRPTTLAFTFLDDYRLDLSVRSLVGSRSRLQDVPKIAQLIESRVHAWFDERAVEPRFQQIVLPSLWPRKHNTRGGASEDQKADGDAEHTSNDEGIDVTPPDAPTLLPAANIPHITSTAPVPELGAPFESRMEAEGAKLREAEIMAGERSRPREHQDLSSGMRWRGDQNLGARTPPNREENGRRRPHLSSLNLNSNRGSGEWSGQRGMPGAMPGG